MIESFLVGDHFPSDTKTTDSATDSFKRKAPIRYKLVEIDREDQVRSNKLEIENKEFEELLSFAPPSTDTESPTMEKADHSSTPSSFVITSNDRIYI